jgi:hypothetical protein
VVTWYAGDCACWVSIAAPSMPFVVVGAGANRRSTVSPSVALALSCNPKPASTPWIPAKAPPMPSPLFPPLPPTAPLLLPPNTAPAPKGAMGRCALPAVAAAAAAVFASIPASAGMCLQGLRVRVGRMLKYIVRSCSVRRETSIPPVLQHRIRCVRLEFGNGFVLHNATHSVQPWLGSSCTRKCLHME